MIQCSPGLRGAKTAAMRSQLTKKGCQTGSNSLQLVLTSSLAAANSFGDLEERGVHAAFVKNN